VRYNTTGAALRDASLRDAPQGEANRLKHGGVGFLFGGSVWLSRWSR